MSGLVHLNLWLPRLVVLGEAGAIRSRYRDSLALPQPAAILVHDLGG